MRRRRFALVAGGGTGGHIVPALAVARGLAARRGQESVEVVGSRRGLDSRLVQGSGFPVTLLPGRGFRRSFSAAAILANASAAAQLAAGLVLAVVVVLRRRPAVVVAMGGYACVPVSVAAVLCGVPVVLVNVDAVPGAANRLVGRFAKAAAVAFAGTPLARSVVTGAPVRDEIITAAHPDRETRDAAREMLTIPSGRKVVAVVGGSLGAHRINEAVIGMARIWTERSDLAVYHVVGRRDSSWASEAIERTAPSGLWYHQVAYENRMPLFYEAADVVLCRAGANTVAELTVVGVPAVLIPLPRSPGDHQAANAAVLERAGAAVVVEDRDCEPQRLAAELAGLLGDDERLESMRASSARLGRTDAVGKVVELVEENARRGRSKSTGSPQGAQAVAAR